MVVVLFLFMALIVVLYLKLENNTIEKFLIILTVFLFSIIIGTTAIVEFAIPFSPYLQLFFLLFQTIFFILTALESYKGG